MIKSVFVKADTTLYKDIPSLNSGLDEVLELRKSFLKINAGTIAETSTTTPSLSRILIKFDVTDVSSSIVKNQIQNPRFYLKLNTTTVKNVQTDYTIEAFPVSQSWVMGSGKKHSIPIIASGASWDFRDSTTHWDSSISASSQGGTWYSAYSASQTFSYESTDINMDVTDIVKAWLSQSIQNNGFIVKFSSSLETDGQEYGAINFFSRDTHTIYPPLLQVKWDDSIYVTGSLSRANISTMLISVNNLRDKYKSTEVARVGIFARDKFPPKLFTTGARYLVGQYLPSSSYYSIEDASTNDILIPFDTASTKLSCNGSENFFMLDMSGLQPERFYKLVLRFEDSSSSVVLDDKFYFKVER